MNSAGPTFTFISIDVPGASNTIATGINAPGAIVGIYYDTAGNEHGFLLKNGNFSTVDVPGSLVGVSGTLQTEANGINAAGEIVGDYFAPPGAPGAPACTADSPPFSPQCRRGFLYRKGEFSDVLVPGKKGSIPNAISPDGTIYGCDHDDDYFTSMVGFGRIGLDTFITLDAGGGELKNPEGIGGGIHEQRRHSRRISYRRPLRGSSGFKRAIPRLCRARWHISPLRRSRQHGYADLGHQFCGGFRRTV